MASRISTLKKEERLEVRTTAAQAELLAAAAQVAGSSRSEFVRDAALRRAEEVLTEQARFSLGPDAWAAFVAALEELPRENEALRKLFKETDRLREA